MRLSFALVVLALALGLAGCSSSTTEPQRDPRIAAGLEVTTSDGPVRGAADKGARSWKGIPFAAPPTGPNRFRAPQPVTPWTAVREATAFGSNCAQSNLEGKFGSGTEDCLFLNVWSPDPAPLKARPVMVFVHGGAFVIGSGSGGIYDGTALASSRDVVIVTLNYRLGALGFLAHSALLAEDPANGTGNYGLLDQRAALQWVKKNIRAFGGDPDDVTLFGESAGAWSVSLHLTAPSSAGLFQRAIVESGATPVSQRLSTVAEAEAETAALVTALGCTDPVITCLRAKSFQDVTSALVNSNPPPGGIFQGSHKLPGWLPVVDGVFMPEQPTARFAAGKVNVVPTIVGSNFNEGTLFHAGLLGDIKVTTQQAYDDALKTMFGADSPKVAARYPVSAYKDFDAALAQIDSDAIFTCPTRGLARSLTKAGATVYRYQLTRATDLGAAAALGATHASELPYVFGNNDALQAGIDDRGQPLREAIMRYWTRFADVADPNGGTDPAWPKYDTATDPYLVLDIPPAPAKGLLTETCDFWDSLPPLYFVTY